MIGDRKPSLEHPLLGRITYVSRYWDGHVRLDGFETPFQLIVRAGPDGPSEKQVAAMARLASDSARIRREASAPMIEVHRESGLVPGGLGADLERIWDALEPEQIELSNEDYYRDGRIAVLLIFGSLQEPDFAPAIETADGRFVQVLGGT